MSCYRQDRTILPVSCVLPSNICDSFELVWSDEFEGQQIDTTKWNYRAEGSVRNYATVSRNTIQILGNGTFSIRVQKDSSGNFYVGQLSTQNTWLGKYGYYECRAWMNHSKGPHIAFWLQSPTMSNTGNLALNGTEIDVFEYHRMNPDSIYHTIHWDGYGSSHKQVGTRVFIPEIATGFHTFGLEWDSLKYVFYVDGIKTWQTNTAVSNRSEYMILSTELTGFGGNPALGTYPDSVVFDYVRVYQRR